MGKIVWSIMFLALAGAIVVYHTASQAYRHHAVLAAKVPTPHLVPGGEEESQVDPLVLMPQSPPQFLLDFVEPIVVQSELSPAPPLHLDLDITLPPLSVQYSVPDRMPYADEPSPVRPGDAASQNPGETTVLFALLDLLQNILPGSPEVDLPVVEDPVAIPDAQEDLPQTDLTPAELQMPLVIDPHHHHQSCPYPGNPRVCPTFPQPAYHFSRPTPAAPNHLTPVRVHGGVEP